MSCLQHVLLRFMRPMLLCKVFCCYRLACSRTRRRRGREARRQLGRGYIHTASSGRCSIEEAGARKEREFCRQLSGQIKTHTSRPARLTTTKTH